jgi:hypothetical protein
MADEFPMNFEGIGRPFSDIFVISAVFLRVGSQLRRERGSRPSARTKEAASDRSYGLGLRGSHSICQRSYHFLCTKHRNCLVLYIRNPAAQSRSYAELLRRRTRRSSSQTPPSMSLGDVGASSTPVEGGKRKHRIFEPSRGIDTSLTMALKNPRVPLPIPSHSLQSS